MKNSKFLLTIMLFALVSNIAVAKPSKKQTVTGVSNGKEYFIDTACAIAMLDAQEKASETCFAKGYADWTYASFEDCKERLFSSKRTIKMNFYCIK